MLLSLPEGKVRMLMMGRVSDEEFRIDAVRFSSQRSNRSDMR
jgi:hypothetical protein